MEKKEVKFSRNEAAILNKVLENIKVKGMGVDARRSLIGLKVDLGRLVKSAEEFQKETIESHKPENFDELQSNQTEEGKKEFETLVKDIESKVREVLNPYFDEEVAVSFVGITQEEFDKLTDLNDMTLAAFEYLNEKLLA